MEEVKMPHTCRIKNRGHAIKRVKNVTNKAWRGIAYELVERWTCPCCGATQTTLQTNGTSVSLARSRVLVA